MYNLEPKYIEIIESVINGQRTQAFRQFKSLSDPEKEYFIKNMDYENGHCLDTLILIAKRSI